MLIDKVYVTSSSIPEEQFFKWARVKTKMAEGRVVCLRVEPEQVHPVPVDRAPRGAKRSIRPRARLLPERERDRLSAQVTRPKVTWELPLRPTLRALSHALLLAIVRGRGASTRPAPPHAAHEGAHVRDDQSAQRQHERHRARALCDTVRPKRVLERGARKRAVGQATALWQRGWVSSYEFRLLLPKGNWCPT